MRFTTALLCLLLTLPAFARSSGGSGGGVVTGDGKIVLLDLAAQDRSTPWHSARPEIFGSNPAAQLEGERKFANLIETLSKADPDLSARVIAASQSLRFTTRDCTVKKKKHAKPTAQMVSYRTWTVFCQDPSLQMMPEDLPFLVLRLSLQSLLPSSNPPTPLESLQYVSVDTLLTALRAHTPLKDVQGALIQLDSHISPENETQAQRPIDIQTKFIN